LHKAVLPSEVLQYLDPREGEIIFDGTLGAGGHAKLILTQIGPKGTYIGVDRDSRAVEIAQKGLGREYSNAIFRKGSFANMDSVLRELKINHIDGCLLDLGISSDQLAADNRGFSFQSNAFLDMRMDQEQGLTAFEVVNSYREEDLANVLFQFGEERKSRVIARNIIAKRKVKPIQTTNELVDIITSVLPRRGKIHPATRTFQALRIEVNQELKSLSVGLQQAMNCLAKNGRLAVISFHSLEDRIVKQQFRQWSEENKAEILTKKPICASDEEQAENPRSRSAKLRAVKKVTS